MSNSTAPAVITYSDRDDYGRSRHNSQVAGRVVCVRVTLPKIYREKYGHAYIVNDWAATRAGGDPRKAATHCLTLKEARALEAAIVAREVAALSA